MAELEGTGEIIYCNPHYRDVETEAQGGKRACLWSLRAAEAELDQTLTSVYQVQGTICMAP